MFQCLFLNRLSRSTISCYYLAWAMTRWTLCRCRIPAPSRNNDKYCTRMLPPLRGAAVRRPARRGYQVPWSCRVIHLSAVIDWNLKFDQLLKKMSRTKQIQTRPELPGLEEILSDLQSAPDDDVAFTFLRNYVGDAKDYFQGSAALESRAAGSTIPPHGMPGRSIYLPTALFIRDCPLFWSQEKGLKKGDFIKCPYFVKICLYSY